MDPNIKNIQLTGPLAGGSDGKSRKKSVKGPRKTFKIGQEGAGATSTGTLVQLESSRLPGVPPPGTPEPVGVDSPLTGTGAPLMVAPTATVTTQSAGKKDVPMKIVLAAAKKKKGGVVLAAAKTKVGDSKTKKISKTKKVRVTISNLGKKIHKAKEIRKAATDTSIEDVKKELQKAALIKPESKAPDAMLRQLYADFMMLKGRAL
jgi:plasmid stability protein